ACALQRGPHAHQRRGRRAARVPRRGAARAAREPAARQERLRGPVRHLQRHAARWRRARARPWRGRASPRALVGVASARASLRYAPTRMTDPSPDRDPPLQHFDVLIVGAGLSGIGAACHLQASCPGKSYAILEARERSGGTWDLFRYPGIRSDSDMYTLGYAFKPWEEAKAIADGPSILRYVKDTAREHGVDRKVRYRHQVKRASWSSTDSRWTAEVEEGGDM